MTTLPISPSTCQYDTFETTNRLGEKFLMRKLANGVIETVKYLGTNKKLQDSEVCPDCGHIGILHQYSKSGCCGLEELNGYTATVCSCKRKRDLT